jgi:hypothetical protein
MNNSKNGEPVKNRNAQPSAAQPSAAQSRAAQTSNAQTSALQTSNAKNVTAQSSNAKNVTAKPSTAKNVTAQTSTNSNKVWERMINENNWTTILAYQLKSNLQENANGTPNKKKTKNIETLLKYEALLTQCCYLSRMAYSPADIFCRMTEHLDVTPNAFNNYIRAIEKIYQNLFDYKCSYDSKYIQEHSEYQQYFGTKKEIQENNKVGFFIRNDEQLNVYLYVYDNKKCEFNKKKTLFISFKGSSSIQEFKKNFLSAGSPDKPISDLYVVSQIGGNGESENDPLIPKKSASTSSPEGKAGGGFIDVLKNSIQEICQKIKELVTTEFERIIITGHSAGGVYATLFSYYIKKYKPEIPNTPIHLVTFGACCTFDAIARNEFNNFLNIKDESKGIFTLDRVTVFGDPIILLPVDLDHPGFTLLKGTSDFRAFTKTERTKEIGELRKMLGLKGGFDGNDLLLSKQFVDLFSNADYFKPGGEYDVNFYKSKFRIKFGTDAKEQRLVLKKAMRNSNENKIKKLFAKIETEANKNIYKQSGGISFGKGLGEATDKYKELTKSKMPNEIEYSCYKIMSMGFCHGVYMGVTYMTVLRVPGITGGLKLKKEPRNNYTLYKQDERVYSLSDIEYKEDPDCTKVKSNVSKNINASNAKSGAKSVSNSGINSGTKSVANSSLNSGNSKIKKEKKGSFMSGLKGIFGKTSSNHVNNNEKKPLISSENPEEAEQAVAPPQKKRCSIL